MQRTDTSRTTSPISRAKEGCCTDAPCETGLRNHYFVGKRLTADSFRIEQNYLLERRRLLNRAIHGWGVLYGYALKPAPADDYRGKENWGRLEIGPGLALDECGRELLQTRSILIGLDDVTLFDAKGTPLERPPNGSYEHLRSGEKGAAAPTRACWLLSAHYAEQQVGPFKVNDPCSCERDEWEHVCETVRFSLRLVDCESCCAGFDCELTCGCGTGPCCENHSKKHPATQKQEQARDFSEQGGPGHPSTDETRSTKNPVHRGGCQCLCEHAMGLSDTECCRLSDIKDPCAKVRADLHHGVPLACVRLREGECDTLLFDQWIEACGPRRLVKQNDMLFDLIRGCDLTRISAIGWWDWHRSPDPIGWDAFRDSFGAETPPDSGLNLTAKYWVEFSRPVREETLSRACFAINVIVEEDEGGWGVARRVPIVDIAKWAPPGTPPGLVTRATLIVDAGWVDDAIESRKTIFNEDPATVEIEIRGDYIVDCNGQTVDANAVGLSPAPTGNGAPGGTFFSIFYVQARNPQRSAYDHAQRA